jgi:formate/nitrite transporter FocA (FNT family)
MCNALVCMAVWLCYSARSTTDKILAIIPPIARFVAAGIEHCVANMHFIPVPLFIRQRGRQLLRAHQEDGSRLPTPEAVSSSATHCRSPSATSSAVPAWSA